MYEKLPLHTARCTLNGTDCTAAGSLSRQWSSAWTLDHIWTFNGLIFSMKHITEIQMGGGGGGNGPTKWLIVFNLI
jgi:hypothetical protein